MFQAETGNNFYKEIPLSEILAVETVKTRAADTEHYLEIRTANLDYFVGSGEDEGGPAGWEAAIRQSLMPAGAAGAAGATGGSAGAAGSEPGGEKTEAPDISQSYQIFPDEVLGSGQFGIVYGGVHR